MIYDKRLGIMIIENYNRFNNFQCKRGEKSIYAEEYLCIFYRVRNVFCVEEIAVSRQ